MNDKRLVCGTVLTFVGLIALPMVSWIGSIVLVSVATGLVISSAFARI